MLCSLPLIFVSFSSFSPASFSTAVSRPSLKGQLQLLHSFPSLLTKSIHPSTNPFRAPHTSSHIVHLASSGTHFPIHPPSSNDVNAALYQPHGVRVFSGRPRSNECRRERVAGALQRGLRIQPVKSHRRARSRCDATNPSTTQKPFHSSYLRIALEATAAGASAAGGWRKSRVGQPTVRTREGGGHISAVHFGNHALGAALHLYF